MGIKPQERPNITRADAEAAARAHGVTDTVFVLGFRGYYLNSMGKVGENDRALYDDAVAVVGPGIFATFNFNTDPGAYREGMACLEPGVHVYQPGPHPMAAPNYPAFRQAREVVVRRDQTAEFKAGVQHPKYGYCLGEGRWRGLFGINIHRGGNTRTSSLGCQTVPPDQWDEFHKTVHAALTAAGARTFKYIMEIRQG